MFCNEWTKSGRNIWSQIFIHVFFNKLKNLDSQGKVGFSSIKIYKSGCFAGYFRACNASH